MITTNTTGITKEVISGKAYFTTVRRGVSYCAYLCESYGEWFVSSHRLALGRHHAGSGKYYENIEDCKPFAALPTLLNLGAL